MAESVIRVSGLTKQFDGFTAVDHVDFDVKKGEIFGFLGPNGAGKSTTIRMLCTLSRPTDGTATVAGFDVGAEAVEQRLHFAPVDIAACRFVHDALQQSLMFMAHDAVSRSDISLQVSRKAPWLPSRLLH